MKIAIIGAAGNVGSAAAFNLAIHRVADELVMIDNFSASKLAQYVYDLESTVTGLDVRVRAGGYADLAGSDVVLIAAGSANVVASRLEVLPQNLPIMREFAGYLRQYCPAAVVVTATNPVCPLNYALYRLTGFERRQFIGFSLNDSIRLRMFLAEALGLPSSRVDGLVIGEHGNSQVLLFSSVLVDGQPYAVPAAVREQVRARVANLPKVLEDLRMQTGRTSAWTTSMGLAAICRAVARDSRRMMPCSVVLDGEYGCRRLGMSVPVNIGRQGVLEIEEVRLEPEERAGLTRSIETLRPAMQFVDDFVDRQEH